MPAPVSRLRLALAMLLLAAVAAAQQTGDERPRVCLVLSGGGALGLAHIGVLEVLEELRVPIDCIAGTSMGAIIGGLYAAGYSPAELREVALLLDWRDLLYDTPDRREVPFRRKVDDLTYLTRWEMGLSGGKLRMPPGLIAGHKLGVALQLLALRALGRQHFDDLPIPFRAVAADIMTGETVVLEQGSLAVALRASMAIPGLFSPVALGDRLLVDGGVVAGLPVEAAVSMDGDVIIAVDLGQPFSAHARPESIASILNRTSDFMTRLNVERALGGVDVLIRPAVGEHELLDFHEVGVIIPAGAAAARDRAADLVSYSVAAEEWQAYLERQRSQTPLIRIAAIEVDPGPGLAPDPIVRSLESEPGALLDATALQRDIERLYSLGEFDTVGFDLDPTETAGAYRLRIQAHPKPWGPNFLRFGLSLASDLEGQSSFNALAALTVTRVNQLGAEVKTAAQAGEAPFGSAEFYQPLAHSSSIFASASLMAAQTKVQVPVDDELVQYRFWLQRAKLDLGLSLGRWGEARVGLRHQTVTGRASEERPRIDLVPRFDRTDAGFTFSLVLDQLDSINFPRRGFLAVADVYEARTVLGADTAYHKADLELVAAATRGRHTLLGLVTARSALGGVLPGEERLQLGGLLRLSGLPPGEVSGSYGGVAGLMYLWQIGRLPAFGEGLYLGGSVEAGNAWESASDARVSDLRHSAAVIFGADTVIGPIYLAHGSSSGGKDSFYLFVGRTF